MRRGGRRPPSAELPAEHREARAPLPAWLDGGPHRWRIRIAAQPGATRNEITGEHDGCLRLRIVAPPVEGRANEEIVRFLSERLDVPRRALQLIAGASARRKVVALDAALDAEAIVARIGLQG